MNAHASELPESSWSRPPNWATILRCMQSESRDPLYSYQEAFGATVGALNPLPPETLPLSELVGRVAAQDLPSLVDSPSIDASLKDGYAVRSSDVATANPQHPVILRNIGSVAAGGFSSKRLLPGTTMRILSGAPIPAGADAVLAEEFAAEEGQNVLARADAHPGRNIIKRGTDVACEQRVVAAGTTLRPAQIGLLAAAGYGAAPVVRNPRVAIIATGDEVVAPGKPLPEGKLFASNLVTLQAWCHFYGIIASTHVAADRREAIRDALLEAIVTADTILTSGGAWKGERDLVVSLLDELGWHKVYHRVRLGPGKAVGFGLWRGKPVFTLPGGPPSNQMAFLQLALPGLHLLGGRSQIGLPTRHIRLATTVTGQRDWTQFIPGRLRQDTDGLAFEPLRWQSRLQEMAACQGYLQIPEGVGIFQEDTMVTIQVLPR
jgi:molybdopterin molybdotransferase